MVPGARIEPATRGISTKLDGFEFVSRFDSYPLRFRLLGANLYWRFPAIYPSILKLAAIHMLLRIGSEFMLRERLTKAVVERVEAGATLNIGVTASPLVGRGEQIARSHFYKT